LEYHLAFHCAKQEENQNEHDRYRGDSQNIVEKEIGPNLSRLGQLSIVFYLGFIFFVN
jgi:hypothetical protein